MSRPSRHISTDTLEAELNRRRRRSLIGSLKLQITQGYGDIALFHHMMEAMSFKPHVYHVKKFLKLLRRNMG